MNDFSDPTSRALLGGAERKFPIGKVLADAPGAGSAEGSETEGGVTGTIETAGAGVARLCVCERTSAGGVAASATAASVRTARTRRIIAKTRPRTPATTSP